MIKKLIALIAALAVAAALASAGWIYPTTMRAVTVDAETDTVTLETATGFVYTMKGVEDYAEGDLVSVLMWSNGTKIITDDTILAARYSGWYC